MAGVAPRPSSWSRSLRELLRSRLAAALTPAGFGWTGPAGVCRCLEGFAVQWLSL